MPKTLVYFLFICCLQKPALAQKKIVVKAESHGLHYSKDSAYVLNLSVTNKTDSPISVPNSVEVLNDVCSIKIIQTHPRKKVSCNIIAVSGVLDISSAPKTITVSPKETKTIEYRFPPNFFPEKGTYKLRIRPQVGLISSILGKFKSKRIKIKIN